MSRLTIKGKRIELLIARADVAIENQFYLETIAICYAIIEERLRSVLQKVLERELGKKHKIDSCLDYIKKQKKTDPLLAKYFTKKLLDDIYVWKEVRNEIMHELVESGLNQTKAQSHAATGRELLASLAATTMKWKKEFIKC